MSLKPESPSCAKKAGLSLDELAKKATISKTYLWELERRVRDEEKPSADVLLRIANALSTTIAVLMELPTVKVKEVQVEIPSALRQLQERLKSQGTPLTPQDLRDLVTMRFRGGQPHTGWTNGISSTSLSSTPRGGRSRERLPILLKSRSISSWRKWAPPIRAT